MFAGLGAARIRRLFAEARKHRPAIIFIDEIDAVGGERGSDNNSEREQTLNQLLVEMDGFGYGGDVVVIAASNLLEKLDPALLRPGRFDRQIFVSPPDVAGREAILQGAHARQAARRDVDLGMIARQTSGPDRRRPRQPLQRGGDLRRPRSTATQLAQADFDAALERVVAGMQSRRTLNEHERRVVAFHEAGHALCAELLPGVDRVHKISIVPRGRALGYTLNLPEEDRYLKTREELIDYMAVLLGGRAAEEIVFGAITTGAVRRPARAWPRSRARWSTSTRWARRSASLQRRRRGRRGLRPHARAARRGAAAPRRRGACAARVRLIREHREKLDELAVALLRNEVLERDDIERIMAGVPRFHRSPGQGLRVVAIEPPKEESA